MTHPVVLVTQTGSELLACLLVLGAMAACGHTEPFGSRSFGSDQPFDPGPPVRLTLNRGPDRDAAWLPDGSGILYSAVESGTSDHDVCLALLPPTGGRQLKRTCDLSPAAGDSTDALESAAPAGDGRLAFVATSSRIGVAAPDRQAIVLASVVDPVNRQVLRFVPYTIPGERTHSGVSQLRWLGSNRLLYLGEQVTYRTPCQVCPLDTLRSGLDATWLSLGEAAITPRRVPGTDYASGVSAGSTEDEVYYTLGGDSRVYRQVLSTGAVTVLYDFGATGFARDVHVMGGRMAAVVGGRVAFGIDSTIGPTQWDSGGRLHVVDLLDGTDIMVDAPGLIRRPQLSPSGSQIIAEVYPLLIDPVSGDTIVSRNGDLYLFGQP